MLRKPVISTHWSGNVDFRNEGEQLLVEGPLRKVEPGQYPWGAGQVWMDPDVSAAAQAFRAAAEIRSLPPASSAFDPAKVGARYRLRLEKLGLISQPE
jgi:hypothetical protein